MPKATDEQRKAFAEALFEAMREPAQRMPPATRLDNWLGERIGLSGQAIRNYLSASREPKNARIVEAIEDALEVPRHHLGRHLGYGPSTTQRLEALETQVETLSRELRGVAVLLVVIAHSISGVGSSPALLPGWHSGGGLIGVQVFFVLSGFLITGILVGEHEREGRVDLARFYARRVRRLLPALVVACTGVVGWVAVTSPEQIRHAAGSSMRALLYVGNLGEHQPFHEYGPWLGHTWSLAVEEQFYLAWPLLVLVAMRIGGRMAVGWLAAGVLVATVVARVWVHGEPAYGMLRWDALAAGCLLAVWPTDLRWFVLPACAVLVTLTVTYGHSIGQLDYLVATAASSVLIASAAVLPVRAGWLRHVGTISYGMYLWHSILLGFDVPVLVAIPGAVLAAELSWRLVERRLLVRQDVQHGEGLRSGRRGAGRDRADRATTGGGGDSAHWVSPDAVCRLLPGMVAR